MAIAPEITHPAELLPLPETSHYFNREQSWLEFNRRVLEEALDEQIRCWSGLSFSRFSAPISMNSL